MTAKERFARTQIVILTPLLFFGIFGMLFWTAWEYGVKSMDGGLAQLLLHNVTDLLLIPAVFSVLALFLVWKLWIRTSFTNLADPQQRLGAIAFVCLEVVVISVLGLYAGLAYAFYLEDYVSLQPYQSTARWIIMFYNFTILALQGGLGLRAMSYGADETVDTTSGPSTKAS